MRNLFILGTLVLLKSDSDSYRKCNNRNTFLLKVSNMKNISELLFNLDSSKICHLKIRLINISIIRCRDLPKISEIEKVSIFRDEVRHIESGAFKLWNVINCLELSVIRKQTFDGLQNLRN